MLFNQLGLKTELLRAIEDQGYTTPTPIQAQSIPVVLSGRDILAGAQTGTGKTAAFTLPLLQLLSDKPQRGRAPRALVLTPTRELAAQVEESVATYGKHLPLRSTVVFGGVGFNTQKQRLKQGVDILVATPGRLLDHANQKTVDLSMVQVLILDEADRMLDMGFIHDIRKILKLLPQKRQNLLFSATYSEDIKRLSDGLLKNPKFIEVARRNTTAETVSQVVHRIDKNQKRHLLSHLIKKGDWHQVLVFTRTKHGANRLAKQLVTDGISADAIHGNKSQGARTRALANFKKNEVRVLVATDIAARGLDIEKLPHVVNYELPNVPEDYVHRIGRTGRAGTDGSALSLLSEDEEKHLVGIQRLLKKKLPVENVDDFVPRAVQPQSESRNNNSGQRPDRNRPRRNSSRSSNSDRSRSRSSAPKQENPSRSSNNSESREENKTRPNRGSDRRNDRNKDESANKDQAKKRPWYRRKSTSDSRA